jgi:ankyrin repeat protein
MKICSLLNRLSHSPIPRLGIVSLIALVCCTPAFCGEIHEMAAAGNMTRVETLLKANPELLSITDDYGKMPLHWAVINGHKDVAELLLEHGADINVKDKYREILLNKEVMQGSKDTAATSNGISLTESAKAVIYGYFADYSSGYTPLHLTAIDGMKDMAEFLLARGAHVNVRTNIGETPLHYAALHGHKDLVKLLLSNKAEVNAKSRNGGTPLDEAIMQNHMNIAELLRQQGGVIGNSKKFFFFCSAE